jgi:plasmid stabilization system protein ParE
MANYKIYFSARATKDFKSIQRYTLKKFGENQVWKYTGMLQEGLRRLEENPKLHGHHRPDIPKKYLSSNVGGHSLIYRVNEKDVYLVAILHSQMDFVHQLSKQD